MVSFRMTTAFFQPSRSLNFHCTFLNLICCTMSTSASSAMWQKWS